MADVNVRITAEDNFSGVMGNFGSIITGIESAIRLAADTFRIFSDFALQGLDAIASYERLGLALQTLGARELLATGEAKDMTEALAMSGDRAQELLDWMQQLAINSPFTLEGVSNAFRTAQAYGFTADEAKRLTEAMINFAAGTGANEQVMGQIALALGQIEAKGKLAGQEVLQLVNAGLPVTQILAEAFGVTTAELVKMQQDGLVPAKEAIEAITVYLETNFEGAAQRQALSWAGLMGTFEDIKQMGLREFFGGIFDALQPVAIELSTWLQGEGLAKLGEWGAKLGEFTVKLIELNDVDVETLGGKIDAAVGKIFDTLSRSIKDWVINHGPEQLGDAAISWLDKLGTGPGIESKAATAAQNLMGVIAKAIGEVPIAEIADAMDKAVARGIDNTDWASAGLALSTALSNLFRGKETNLKLPDNWLWFIISPTLAFLGTSEVGRAAGDAINNFIAGIFGYGSLEAMEKSFSDAFAPMKTSAFWRDVFFEVGAILLDTFTVIGTWIGDGIVNGIESYMGVSNWDGVVTGIKDGLARALTGYTTWDQFAEDFWISFDKVIAFFKLKLGISSPSTVFAGFGRDMVMGLIVGFTSAWAGLIATIGTLMQGLLNLMPDWLQNFLGVGGGTSASGLGTAGGGVAGTGTTELTGTQSYYNYYYGNVYFQGTGQTNGGVDCVYPNPILNATAGGGVAPATPI